MLTIERFCTASPEQMEFIIDGMRNPMNSWDLSDSYITHVENPVTANTADFAFHLGENDEKLMRQLAAGGPVHAKYRRMMPVYVDIIAPLYWWKEFDTYKVGTVGNSCSTMHKIHAKEFTFDDFSCEHLFEDDESLEFMKATVDDDAWSSKDILAMTICTLNEYRRKYLDYLKQPIKDLKARAKYAKKLWWQMIQLLPSSYNQKRTIFLTYEVLYNMYHSRRHHKLDEWHVLCDWIEKLPYSYLITGEAENDAVSV